MKDRTIIDKLDVLSEKKLGDWNFLLVSAPENELDVQLKNLQQHMIDCHEDCWYAHFFKEESMIVVYQNAIFKTTIHPEDWKEAVQFGLDHGIPLEQLDFNPRTKEGVFEFFGLPES